jgi:hypothetical protein
LDKFATIGIEMLRGNYKRLVGHGISPQTPDKQVEKEEKKQEARDEAALKAQRKKAFAQWRRF